MSEYQSGADGAGDSSIAVQAQEKVQEGAKQASQTATRYVGDQVETRGKQAAAELRGAIALNAGADIHRRLAGVLAALGRNEESARERGIYVEQRLQQLRQQSEQ